ncbi:hypothetical protein BB561_006687 [Smittium simulii]|uniref:AAA+ ATPase domain-containing protein n=1 Tax=Smittium simulii TaxID=133385 RepID=A0A2T9Y2F1_9FUNG|nr:hypothetical protein BB561_006687 [Smittium simulii]
MLQQGGSTDQELSEYFDNFIYCLKTKKINLKGYPYLDFNSSFNRQAGFYENFKDKSVKNTSLNISLGSCLKNISQNSPENISNEESTFFDKRKLNSETYQHNESQTNLDPSAKIFTKQISKLSELFQLYSKTANFNQLVNFNVPRVILLSGARKSGKTSVLKQAAKLSNMRITTLKISKYMYNSSSSRVLSVLQLFEQLASSQLNCQSDADSDDIYQNNSMHSEGYNILALDQLELLSAAKYKILHKWLSSVSKNIIIVGMYTTSSTASEKSFLSLFNIFDKQIQITLSDNDRVSFLEFLLRQYFGGKLNADFSKVAVFLAMNTLGNTIGDLLLIVKLAAQQLLLQSHSSNNPYDSNDMLLLLQSFEKINISIKDTKPESEISKTDKVDDTLMLKKTLVEKSKNVVQSELAVFSVTDYDKGFEGFGGYEKSVQNLKLWISLVQKNVFTNKISAQNDVDKNMGQEEQTANNNYKIKLNNSVDIPLGVLIYGPPGCGKTLLAQILAHELCRKIIKIDLSKLFSEFLGDSELYVRNLFKAASNNSSIILIDNLESIAAKRSIDGMENSVETRVLSTLLNELDGVANIKSSIDSDSQHNKIVVIATTSKIKDIDEAIIRPGRFSKLVHLPLPSNHDRCEIIKKLAKKTRLNPDIKFDEIAEATVDWSGAKLSLLHRDACYAASRESKKAICLEHNHYKEALQKIDSNCLQNAFKKNNNCN